MWEIVVESGIIALIFGFVTSVSGIVITNNYSKKRELREKKYILTKEIYQKLVSIYNRQMEKNNVDNIEKSSAIEIFTNAIILVYQESNKKIEELKKSYLEIKYILSESNVRNLDSKFRDIEEIEKTLFFTSLNNQIKNKEDYKNIVVSNEVNIIESDKIQEYMRRYIDEVMELESFFLDIVESELRQLLK